ncbi:MAG: ThiF family adenylyltransferase [Candidatus Sedimenticola sp. (ex Thyasira tokunagai)]
MKGFERDILFSRMIGLISEDELDLLEGKKVAIPGCGGTGFTYAESLVRMGVGSIHISDEDTFGAENMNRQFGCTVHTVGQPKVKVLSERLSSIVVLPTKSRHPNYAAIAAILSNSAGLT